jgi:hypothetical protein
MGTTTCTVRSRATSRPNGDVTRIAALPATLDEFHQHPLIGRRERLYEVFERLDHDPPLWFGLLDAECAELDLRLWRNPNAELWVLPDPIARAQAGGRSSAPGTAFPISASNVPRHARRSVGYGPFEQDQRLALERRPARLRARDRAALAVRELRSRRSDAIPTAMGRVVRDRETIEGHCLQQLAWLGSIELFRS